MRAMLGILAGVFMTASSGAWAEQITLHFHGSPAHDAHADGTPCSGIGQLDVLLCEGPWLLPDATLGTGPAARSAENTGSDAGNDANINDPQWTWRLSAPITIEAAPATVKWWAACPTVDCTLFGTAWVIELWVDGAKKFTSGAINTAPLPLVPERLEATVNLPKIEASSKVVLALRQDFINTGAGAIVYYDTSDACPGALAGPCDSTVTFGDTPPPDTDADGVPDAIDACPGTPVGAPVNEQGCPVDVCVAPGRQLIDDAAGDQLGAAAGVNTAFDIRSLHIAQAKFNGVRKLLATLKVADLESVPSMGTWVVTVTAGTKTYEMSMTNFPDQGGVKFNYTSDGTILGPLDAESTYTADGTIQMVLAAGKIGAAPGVTLSGISFDTRQSVGISQGYLNGQAMDSASTGATYTAVSNQFCGDTGGGGENVTVGGPTYDVYPTPLSMGNDSGEPTLDVNLRTGSVFYIDGLRTIRAKFDDVTSPAQVTWEDKSGDLTSKRTLDPILTGDQFPLTTGGPPSGRIWVSQLAGATSLMEYSDDDGETWLPTQGSGQPHGVDNQSVAAGPYPPGLKPATATYGNALYYCSHSAVNAFCSRSDDGGTTFNPSRPISPVSNNGCNNHGHVKVGPDGVVYVPQNTCEGTQGVIVSEDAGQTWQYRAVRLGPNSFVGSGRADASVAIDKAGTIYFGYTEAGDDVPRVAVSRNKGVTWERFTNLGPALGVVSATFNAMVAGDDGRAAYFFLGTDKPGDFEAVGFTGVWYPFVATTFDGGLTWTARNASPNDPVQRGDICHAGLGCGASQHRNLLDFNDATVDAQGRVLAVFADGCTGPCVSGAATTYNKKGTIIRQSGGKRLYAAFDPVGPSEPSAPNLTAIRDPLGVYLTWVEPEDNDSPIERYKIYRSVDGGAETLLTQTDARTFYEDYEANDPDASYTYRIVAVNGIGASDFSNAVTPPLGGFRENVCTAPGLTFMEDAAGDSTGGVPFLDVTSLRVSEPQSLDGNIVFTMKVASLDPVPPPGALWAVSFKTATPPADGDGYYVAMVSDNAPTPRYIWGTWRPQVVDAGGVTSATLRVMTEKGTLNAASTFATDGTIQLVVAKSAIGNPAHGSVLTAIDGTTRATLISRTGTSAAGLHSSGSTDITGEGFHVLRGARDCLPNTAPVAALGADRTSGPPGLLVQFDASLSQDDDVDDTIAEYSFDFGDESLPVTQASPYVSHTYPNVGAYAAKVRVKDSRGKAGTVPASVTILIQEAATDADGDGIADEADNCPGDANPGQEDGDGDGIGDACDAAADVTPDAFTFTERTNVPTNQFVTSEARTISGINAPAAVSIAGGQYSLDGGAYTTSPGTVTAGQVLRVRHVSSSLPGGTVTSTVTVGTYSTAFRSTTTTDDRTPDAFGFATQTGVELATEIESNVITPVGYNVPVSVVAGPNSAYRINGGAWTTLSGTINPGDTLQTRHTSSSSNLTYTKTYVKVGGVTGYFTTRTK